MVQKTKDQEIMISSVIKSEGRHERNERKEKLLIFDFFLTQI